VISSSKLGLGIGLNASESRSPGGQGPAHTHSSYCRGWENLFPVNTPSVFLSFLITIGAGKVTEVPGENSKAQLSVTAHARAKCFRQCEFRYSSRHAIDALGTEPCANW